MSNAFDNLSWNDDFSGAVRLPFPALTVRVLNGDPKMKGIKPDARYFGGFAYGADDAAKLLADGDLRADPAWIPYEATGEKGDYREAAHRQVQVAVIKGRMRWGNDTAKQYSTKYFPGARMHIQYLAGLFKLVKGLPEFCGMAMLTAKGHQANHLQTSIDTAANFIRTAVAGKPGLMKLPRPAWILTLGTEGDKPEFKPVGQSVKSTITPIKAILPASPDDVAVRRVSDDVVAELAERFSQAQQWLNAWKTSSDAEHVALVQNDAFVGEEVEERPF